MIPKSDERIRAIELRRNGLSYSEILKRIPVSKSSLSLWLRSVGLAKRHIQRLTEKKRASLQRGWAAWHQVRVDRTEKLIDAAKKEVGKISSRDLWLIGIVLYWGEGSKQKPHNVSQGVIFSNSDPLMIKLFLKWLRETIKVSEDHLGFELYIHESSKTRIPLVVQFWNEVTSNSRDTIPTYFKKDKIRSLRRNIGENYFGVLRIKVRKSTDLNRRIAGWIQGICDNCRVV